MNARIVPFPPHVPTDRERWRIEQQIREEGLLCGCGREAGPSQVEDWLDHLWRDPEPLGWACEDGAHACDVCRGRGAPWGADPGQDCPTCGGSGLVYDEDEPRGAA